MISVLYYILSLLQCSFNSEWIVFMSHYECEKEKKNTMNEHMTSIVFQVTLNMNCIHFSI